MDSVMKGLMGAMPPPQNFWARTTPDAIQGCTLRSELVVDNVDAGQMTSANGLAWKSTKQQEWLKTDIIRERSYKPAPSLRMKNSTEE